MTIQETVDQRDPAAVRRAIRALQPGESLCLDVPLTVEEFYELVDEDSGVELIHGVITMPSPATDPHEDLFVWLLQVLAAYVQTRQLGRIRSPRTAMRVGPRAVREPDLLFVSNANLHRLQRLELAGPADFIVEIVDSTAARREAVAKQSQYEELGVPELWVVDLPHQELRQFWLEGGQYRRAPVDPEGEVEAHALPGFRLQVAWLFQGPDFPNGREVVDGLLNRAR
jgi:Uma2 family endonuclease